jgi:ABC-type Fe3+-hydroxamate transport system substrate-binding protein
MIVTSINHFTQSPRRIVSLVPSITELLSALELEEKVVGITKFCVHPNHWRNEKVIVGGTKTVNIEKVKSLQPDLIIANKEENIKEQILTLAEDFDVWVTDVNDIEDAIQMIQEIGAITDSSDLAEKMLNDINQQLSISEASVSSIPAIQTAYLIWKDPYMSVGGDTYINAMLEMGGFENVFKDKTRYPEITIEQIKAAGCEQIFLSSEPYPFKQKHIDEIQSQLPSIKIELVDGEMFSWYGSSVKASLEYINALRSNIS